MHGAYRSRMAERALCINSLSALGRFVTARALFIRRTTPYIFCTIAYELSHRHPAGAAGGGFAVGIRQSLLAGARRVRARRAWQRVRGRGAGLELSRGASGAARECLAHHGADRARIRATARAAQRRRGGGRSGPGALHRCRAATALLALLSAIPRSRFRARGGPAGCRTVALLQPVSGGLAALLPDRGRAFSGGPLSAAHLRLLPADPAGLRTSVPRHHRQFHAGGAAARGGLAIHLHA